MPVLWLSGRLWPGTPASLPAFFVHDDVHGQRQVFNIYKKSPSTSWSAPARPAHRPYLPGAFHPPGSMFAKRNLMVPGRHPRRDRPASQARRAVSAAGGAGAARHAVGADVAAAGRPHARWPGWWSALAVMAARCCAERALTGATFVVPVPGLRILVDGQPAKGVSHNKLETSFGSICPKINPCGSSLSTRAASRCPPPAAARP